ncbi:MAG: 30S ribosomal protein S5 [Candidatus Paceibacterota bacterium]|nr:MAG: 30S ribosomal protein S5 [Candidatus Paceibacterota bacterium]
MDEQTPVQPTPEVTPTAPAASEPQRHGRGGGQRFGNRRPGGRQGRRPARPMEKPEYEQKTIDLARVARVTKGGKRFSFRATVVIGDGKSRVGIGMGKGKDVAQSVQKAYNQAKKRLVTILTVNGTIPNTVQANFHGATVILKPAKGGVKAGGPVRVVAKLAGITSLTGKLIERTNNKINIAMATIKALGMLRDRARDRFARVAPPSA